MGFEDPRAQLCVAALATIDSPGNAAGHDTAAEAACGSAAIDATRAVMRYIKRATAPPRASLSRLPHQPLADIAAESAERRIVVNIIFQVPTTAVFRFCRATKYSGECIQVSITQKRRIADQPHIKTGTCAALNAVDQ